MRKQKRKGQQGRLKAEFIHDIDALVTPDNKRRLFDACKALFHVESNPVCRVGVGVRVRVRVGVRVMVRVSALRNGRSNHGHDP